MGGEVKKRERKKKKTKKVGHRTPSPIFGIKVICECDLSSDAGGRTWASCFVRGTQVKKSNCPQTVEQHLKSLSFWAPTECTDICTVNVMYCLKAIWWIFSVVQLGVVTLM